MEGNTITPFQSCNFMTWPSETDTRSDIHSNFRNVWLLQQQQQTVVEIHDQWEPRRNQMHAAQNGMQMNASFLP